MEEEGKKNHNPRNKLREEEYEKPKKAKRHQLETLFDPELKPV